MSIPAARGTVITYPIPAYQNMPIQANYFQPSRFVIFEINLGETTTVTTTTPLNYSLGQEVRLIVPPAFGSYQLNDVTGLVISVDAANQVTLNIDSSRNVDAFIYIDPPVEILEPFESAQILAIGDINTGTTNAFGNMQTATYIPASFINISPQ